MGLVSAVWVDRVLGLSQQFGWIRCGACVSSLDGRGAFFGFEQLG